MTDTKAELLPCPFCGEPPRITTRQDEDLFTHNTVEWKGVRCINCDVQFDWPPDAEPSAIEQWNTRVAPATAPAEIAKVLAHEVSSLRRVDGGPGKRAGEIANRIAALRTSPRSEEVREALKRELRISSDFDYRPWGNIERALASLAQPTKSAPAPTADNAVYTPITGRGVEMLENRKEQQPAEAPAGVWERWYLGSMNDGLFIINAPPRPSTDYVWHDRPDGPTLIIPVHGLDRIKAQGICNAHNAALSAPPARQTGRLTDRELYDNSCITRHQLEHWVDDDYRNHVSGLKHTIEFLLARMDALAPTTSKEPDDGPSVMGGEE